jgi:hypothetical protein
MGWVVCPVNAVRASHSAVDLRTCTDADQSLCSTCIEGLVGGFFENICFEKIECLNGLVCRRGVREAITNQDLELGTRVGCPDLGLEMDFCNRAMSWVFVFFPRRIALDPAHAELCMVTKYRTT